MSPFDRMQTNLVNFGSNVVTPPSQRNHEKKNGKMVLINFKGSGMAAAGP